jgi:hypothetical protein
MARAEAKARVEAEAAAMARAGAHPMAGAKAKSGAKAGAGGSAGTSDTPTTEIAEPPTPVSHAWSAFGVNGGGDEFAALAVGAPIVLGADDEASGMDEVVARDIVTWFLAKGGVRAVGLDDHVYIVYSRRGARSLMSQTPSPPSKTGSSCWRPSSSTASEHMAYYSSQARQA